MIQEFVANSFSNFSDFAESVAKTMEEFGGGGSESHSQKE